MMFIPATLLSLNYHENNVHVHASLSLNTQNFIVNANRIHANQSISSIYMAIRLHWVLFIDGWEWSERDGCIDRTKVTQNFTQKQKNQKDTTLFFFLFHFPFLLCIKVIIYHVRFGIHLHLLDGEIFASFYTYARWVSDRIRDDVLITWKMQSTYIILLAYLSFSNIFKKLKMNKVVL